MVRERHLDRIHVAVGLDYSATVIVSAACAAPIAASAMQTAKPYDVLACIAVSSRFS